jgi:NADH-quinone oxidoreductase subunit L
MAGPTPVSALIHGYDGNCRNFMITRLNFLFDLTDVQSIIAVVGAVTALVAATIDWFKMISRKF